MADLNRAYPFADTDLERQVQESLGPRNEEIVARARDAIEQGDAEGLGALMGAAQAEFDTSVAPACPSQLTAPVLHRLLEDKAIAGLTLGGKGVGSQGDGSAQFLVADVFRQRELIELLDRRYGMTGLPLTIPRTRNLRVAVINSRQVKEGEAIGNATVVRIDKDTVTLEIAGEEQEIGLYTRSIKTMKNGDN